MSIQPYIVDFVYGKSQPKAVDATSYLNEHAQSTGSTVKFYADPLSLEEAAQIRQVRGYPPTTPLFREAVVYQAQWELLDGTKISQTYFDSAVDRSIHSAREAACSRVRALMPLITVRARPKRRPAYTSMLLPCWSGDEGFVVTLHMADGALVGYSVDKPVIPELMPEPPLGVAVNPSVVLAHTGEGNLELVGIEKNPGPEAPTARVLQAWLSWYLETHCGAGNLELVGIEPNPGPRQGRKARGKKKAKKPQGGRPSARRAPKKSNVGQVKRSKAVTVARRPKSNDVIQRPVGVYPPPMLFKNRYSHQAGFGVQVVQLHEIVATVTTDATGAVGTSTSVPTNAGIVLNNMLMTRFTQLKAMFDRARLKGVVFVFEPASGTAINGKLWHYMEYGGSTIAAGGLTAVDISRNQTVSDFIPYHTARKAWRKQDPVDLEFIKWGSGTVPFNSKVTHFYYLMGRGLPANTVIGYIRATVIVECTGHE